MFTQHAEKNQPCLHTVALTSAMIKNILLGIGDETCLSYYICKPSCTIFLGYKEGANKRIDWVLVKCESFLIFTQVRVHV